MADAVIERRVIAIAGPAGSGKSQLVAELVERLAGATPLYFDDYEGFTAAPPEEALATLERGEALALPRLVEHLQALRRGDTIDSPLSGEQTSSGRLIIVEAPLGRQLEGMEGLIDRLIWLELPLDIALARKLRGFTETITGPEEAIAFTGWLGGYLDNYLAFTRRLLEWQRERVRPTADIAINATATRGMVARQVVEWLTEREV